MDGFSGFVNYFRFLTNVLERSYLIYRREKYFLVWISALLSFFLKYNKHGLPIPLDVTKLFIHNI